MKTLKQNIMSYMRGHMALLSRNFLVSIMLALSDFASFVISMYIAMGILFLSINNHDAFVDTQQIQG